MMVTTTILILAYLIQFIKINAQSLPGDYVVEYQLRSHLYKWTFTKVTLPITRCLQIAANGSTPSVICDQKYNTTQIEEVMIGLDKYRSLIGSLDLVCAMHDPEGGLGSKICVCTVNRIGGNVTATGESPERREYIQLESDQHLDAIRNDSQTAEVPGVSFQYCKYGKNLTRAMLSGYSGLRVLNVDNIDIETIESGAFDSFRTSLQILNMTGLRLKEDSLVAGLLCNLTSLKFVLLNKLKNAMSEFPTTLFACPESDGLGIPDLMGVFAEGNAFNRLPPFAFGSGAKSITSLNLTNNEISSVTNTTFADMTSLQELNLDDNKLSTFPRGVFSSLKSLFYLSVQNNELTILDTSILGELLSLRELSLNGNQLHTIVGSFGAMKSLVVLHLKHNRISELNATMFNNSYILQDLNLAHNRINYIHDEAFSSLLFLGLLKINYNQLHNSTNLREVFQRRLEHLKLLDVSHNKLTEILPKQFREYTHLSSLEILNLSHNKIHFLAEDGFLYLSELRMIVLDSNRLSEFKPNTFKHLNKLLTLWINENQLVNIPSDAIPANVVWLSLSFNRIRNLPHMTVKQTVLKSIYIGYNKISHLNKTMFMNLPNLTLLNVTHCEIEHLAEATFEPLEKLQALDLSGNKLNLNFSLNYLGNIFHVSYVNLSHNIIESAENLLMHHFKYANFLDISYNPLKVIPDQPKRRPFGTSTLLNRGQISFLYIKNCSLVHVHRNAFELLPNLIHLDLSDNKLRYLDQLNIVLENGNAYTVYLHGNPITCDCRMSWLLQPPYSTRYELSACRLETSNDVVPFDAVSKDQFLCREMKSCFVRPDVCKCFTDNSTSRNIVYVQCLDTNLSVLPQGIPPSTKLLDLRGNDFHTLSFRSFPMRMETIELYLTNSSISRVVRGEFSKFYRLEFLDLSWNDLVKLESGIFSGLYKLKILLLHHNLITVLRPESFETIFSLTVLTLHHNRMTTIEPVVMEAIDGLVYLTNMTLHGNPWQCLCDNATFKHWLLEKSEIVQDLASIQCNNSSVINLADDRFICYDQIPYLRQYDNTVIIPIGVLAGILAVLLACFVVWYKNRMIFFVLIYYNCGWRRKKTEDEACPYDAFMVYSNASNVCSLIVSEFLPRLEPTHKLFIPERDSLPGQVQSEELMATIKRSKRSVFILDPEAIRSDSFYFALQTAYNYTAESENHHRIVLIVMDDNLIKDSWQQLDDHLQAFIKAKRYIKWSDKYFWQKFMYYMPDSLTDSSPMEYELRHQMSESQIQTEPNSVITDNINSDVKYKSNNVGSSETNDS